MSEAADREGRVELLVEIDHRVATAIAAGRFERVDLPRAIDVAGVAVKSVLVGRAGGALCVYANVCRHHAIPLDLGAETPMTDDGRHLLCHQHGAIYRPSDGRCIVGPCRGEKLHRVDGVLRGASLVLSVAP